MPGAPGPELERDARHRLVVGRLDHVDEVEGAERGPLRLDLGTELLDLLVDLADALRVVADGLDSLRREHREHDVCRHGVLLAGSSPDPSTEPSPQMRCSNPTMLVRTTLLAAALAALAAVPAFAQNPSPPFMDGLKPCYVAANEIEREYVSINGHNFTPLKLVDLYVDDSAAQYAGDPPQADADGRLTGAVLAPFIDQGQRVFTVR